MNDFKNDEILNQLSSNQDLDSEFNSEDIKLSKVELDDEVLLAVHRC